MLLAGLHHVAVQVRDVARVAKFYVEVLGLPELRRFLKDDGSLRSVWVGASAAASEGPFLAIEHQSADARGALGWSMVALRIAPEARAQVVAELGARGVAIERETGWTLYVRDPEGNLVGLSHHPHDLPGGAR